MIFYPFVLFSIESVPSLHGFWVQALEHQLYLQVGCTTVIWCCSVLSIIKSVPSCDYVFVIFVYYLKYILMLLGMDLKNRKLVRRVRKKSGQKNFCPKCQIQLPMQPLLQNLQIILVTIWNHSTVVFVQFGQHRQKFHFLLYKGRCHLSDIHIFGVDDWEHFKTKVVLFT